MIAGVRSEDDLKKFSDNPNIRPVLLDVCLPEHRAAALREVTSVLRSENRSFVGIVANAASLNQVPSEFETEEQEQRVFNVNYFGTVRLIRKFLPLLIAEKGRAVIVGSFGRSLPMPFLATYLATKAALFAYANSLRREVERQGVAVTYVSLGSVKTDMVGAASVDDFAGSAYQQLAAERRKVSARSAMLMTSSEDVSRGIDRALFAASPPCTLHLGPAAQVTRLTSLLPQRLLQIMMVKGF